MKKFIIMSVLGSVLGLTSIKAEAQCRGGYRYWGPRVSIGIGGGGYYRHRCCPRVRERVWVEGEWVCGRRGRMVWMPGYWAII